MVKTRSMSNRYKLCADLRRLLAVNPQLLEYVHDLIIEIFFDRRKGSERDISFILRTAPALRSLSVVKPRRSFDIPCLPWQKIPKEAQDALLHAFCAPTLVNLCIEQLACLPPALFGLDVNLECLYLRDVDLLGPGFQEDPKVESSVDLSRMRIHTLDISLSSSDQLQSFLPIISHPHTFISRITALVIEDMEETLPLAVPIMKSAMQSLEKLRLHKHQGAGEIPPQPWIEHDFNLMPKLRHMVLDFALSFDSPKTFCDQVTAAINELVEFLTLNPSALQLKQLDVRFIAWHGGDFPWDPAILRNIGKRGKWRALDKMLDSRRGAEVGVRVELEVSWRWMEEMSAIAHAWRDTIHGLMPLASRRGVLVTDVIPEEP